MYGFVLLDFWQLMRRSPFFDARDRGGYVI